MTIESEPQAVVQGPADHETPPLAEPSLLQRYLTAGENIVVNTAKVILTGHAREAAQVLADRLPLQLS